MWHTNHSWPSWHRMRKWSFFVTNAGSQLTFMTQNEKVLIFRYLLTRGHNWPFRCLDIYDNGASMWLKRDNGLNIPPLCCWSVPINPILDSSPCCPLSTIEMQLIDVHPPWRFRAVLKTLCSAPCVLVHREGGGWVQISRYGIIR